MDVGCYCVNIARTLAGSEPVAVHAVANWAESGVDDQLAGILRFDDGLLAQIDCALTLERRERYVAAGTTGYLDVDASFLPGVEETVIEIHHGRGETTTHRIDGDDEYRLMVEHFAECVEKGVPLRYSASEAASNMRVIESLLASARKQSESV